MNVLFVLCTQSLHFNLYTPGILYLFPGLHTQYWRVLDEQPQPKGQWLILLVDRDSAKATKRPATESSRGSRRGPLKFPMTPGSMYSRAGRLRRAIIPCGWGRGGWDSSRYPLGDPGGWKWKGDGNAGGPLNPQNSKPWTRGAVETPRPGRRTKMLRRGWWQTFLRFQRSRHHKAATALMCWKLALGMADIALIQEPWVQGGQIRGLGGTGALFFRRCTVQL
jgi:hypothetical protein